MFRPGKFARISRAVPALCAITVTLCIESSARAHGTAHEMIEAATRVIAERPGDASAYMRRAQLHLEHGDTAACLLDLAEAERRQHEDIGAGLVRARAFASVGRFAEAKDTADAFLSAHPSHTGALLVRARAFAAMERNAEAADDFARAISLTRQPEPDQILELVNALCRAGRREEALAAVDRSLRATPGVPSLFERAVKVEVERGNFDGALRRVDDAIVVAHLKEPLIARRAALLAQAGRIPESVAAWRSLQARIAALPEAARGSHAMSSLALRARHALDALTVRMEVKP